MRMTARPVLLLPLLLSAALLTAQTRVEPPENAFSVADDVRLGREAAEEAREQLRLLKDRRVTSYVQDVAERLVDAVRPDLRHQEFRYTLEVVDAREINAFALPGGPMFVNRGMLEAAGSEGQAASVMAHEIAHVALRHGTAQASKATPYQIGAVAGAVLGAIIGGRVGTVVTEGTQFGLGVAFLRYGREFERQADIEGAHIMARAGYDPRDMARMFEVIEERGGPGAPEWLSSHPNPGNRQEAIAREAALLDVSDAVRSTDAFARVQAHLRSLPPPPAQDTRRR
jgi:predicted Zn-dependent protease